MEQDTLLSKFKKLFLPDSSKWRYWILLSLAIHSFYFITGAHIMHNGSIWGMIDPDTETYFKPFENLFLHGQYKPDFRMPGYGIIIFPLLFLFPLNTAYNLISLLQLITSSVAVYILSLTAGIIFKNRRIFLITFIILSLCYFIYSFEIVFLTESFTTAFIIFSIYFMGNYLTKSNRNFNLFCSGLFITWTMFLRPVFAPLPIIFAIYLVIRLLYLRKKILLPTLIFISPFILFECTWLNHNYSVYHRIIPLTSTVWLPSYDSTYIEAGNDFFAAWGGGNLRADPKLDHIPQFTYTSAFNSDSLKNLRSLMGTLHSPSISYVQKMATLTCIRNKLEDYAKSIKDEKPFLYYIKAPMANISYLFNFSTMYDVIFFMKLLGKPVELVSYFLYYFIIYAGAAGILLSLIKHKTEPVLLLIAIVALYVVFIHCFVIRIAQNRYLIPVLPCFLVCAIYFCSYIYTSLERKFKKSEKINA